ncbi:MAG: C1 family peptidase, partial [Ignavibacterium sp.]
MLKYSLILLLAFTTIAFPQFKDKAIFTESKPGFYQEMMKEIEAFNQKEKDKRKTFKLDFSSYQNLPKSLDEFKYYWFNEPISQGQTGTCWSFSTTSFYESEVYRIHKKKVKLSEMFTAYWEYVEKAKRFIRERGDSFFGEGSEANAVTRIYKTYGAVPEEVYTGLLPGQKHHDHSKMFSEMENFLKSCKQNNMWNEDVAVENIKAIMNHYMGEPPVSFTYEGKTYTPQSFLKDYLKLNMDDYVDILSYMQQPYWQQVEYEVPDNWWHNKDYYNVPLADFMNAIKSAIKNGFTLAIGGDVSEPGYDSWTKCAVVPTFDIPSEYIDENARQFRFSNETTTDDHGIHLVGYKEQDGKM